MDDDGYYVGDFYDNDEVPAVAPVPAPRRINELRGQQQQPAINNGNQRDNRAYHTSANPYLPTENQTQIYEDPPPYSRKENNVR